MPNYIPAALHKFQHKKLCTPVSLPNKCTLPIYHYKPQWTQKPDLSPIPLPQERNKIQQILGVLLFYAHAVDDTMLAVINSIAAQQATPKESTAQVAVYLLDYTVTHPNTKI
eukprot:15274689-Ditylum_brightwellii.AAC.1